MLYFEASRLCSSAFITVSRSLSSAQTVASLCSNKCVCVCVWVCVCACVCAWMRVCVCRGTWVKKQICYHWTYIFTMQNWRHIIKSTKVNMTHWVCFWNNIFYQYKNIFSHTSFISYAFFNTLLLMKDTGNF